MNYIVDTLMSLWLPLGMAAPLILAIEIPVLLICQVNLMSDSDVSVSKRKTYRRVRNAVAALILLTVVPIAGFYIDCQIKGCTIY